MTTNQAVRIEPAVIVKETTENRKLGPVSATYASQWTCPRTCPWLHAGCYAESGPAGYVTHRLNGSNTRNALTIARQEARLIDGLTGDRHLRLHVVGDARTDSSARVLADASKRYMRRGGHTVWTYTHAWSTVKRSSWGRVSVLASVESTADVRAAKEWEDDG